jgi:D-sedoheptulose 7-phosphate isomerase
MTTEYWKRISDAIALTQWDQAGTSREANVAFREVVAMLDSLRGLNQKAMFVGNGGSAAIAGHMALDFSKAGRITAQAFNDGALLTCLSNDHSFEDAFAIGVEMFGRSGDILIAISSSGNSQNILRAAQKAREKGCRVVTFSGFKPDNQLRFQGDYNVYVPAEEYGTVEVAHYAILHCMLDAIKGRFPV